MAGHPRHLAVVAADHLPVKIPGAIAFTDDDQHTAYDPEQAQHFWLALTRMVPALERFRSGFVGKASPVHLFWADSIWQQHASPAGPHRRIPAVLRTVGHT